MSLLSLDNPVFASYCFYSSLLCLKLLLMGPLTGYYRITKKVFANDEDAKAMGAKEVKMNDLDVERVRRAHLNDLENIPVFWMLAFLYVLTNPSEGVSKILFRAFTISRFMHTILYMRKSNRRGVSYMIGLVVNAFLAVNVICFFSS